MRDSLEELSHDAADWFEEETCRQLRHKGVLGLQRFSNSIGTDGDHVSIPKELGDFDGIGYLPDEGAIAVLEVKRVKRVSNPAMFRADLDHFLGNDRKAWMSKFKRRLLWLTRNLDEITAKLSHLPGFENARGSRRIAAMFVTYWPTPLSWFSDLVPCFSLAELLVRLSDEKAWPGDIWTVTDAEAALSN